MTTTERPDELITLLEGEFQQIIGRVIIQDQKTAGTNGGTFTSGAWRTRDLNITVLNTIGNDYSLSSNQFALSAGVYIIQSFSPAFKVDRHQTRLRNITDGANEIIGSSEFSASLADYTQSSSKIIGSLIISTLKTFEIQDQCQTTKATNGFGIESNSSFIVDKEIYTIVHIWKIG